MLLKKNIPFKYVFGKIKYEIIAIAVYATLIAVIYYAYPSVRISIPLAIPAVLGTVISLLLGFRSNQAYDRWWEARHIWGAIVNESRTLARQVMSFTHNNYHSGDIKAFCKRMIYRQIGWTHSLGKHLRNEDPAANLDKYLDRNEMIHLREVDNVPSALMDEMGYDLRIALEKGWINSYQQVELDRTVTRLVDAMGKCERIKNTVFPVTYSLYIHISLMLFIVLLPFSVIEFFGLLEVPLVIAIAACFLLIEKMAIHLQDPFENKPTDTPMTHIANSIEKNLMQLHQRRINQQNRGFNAGNVEEQEEMATITEYKGRKKEELDESVLSTRGNTSGKEYFIL